MIVYAFNVPGWLESAACKAVSEIQAYGLIFGFNQDAYGIREASEEEIKEISEQGGFIN
jgi:hypothetical protein